MKKNNFGFSLMFAVSALVFGACAMTGCSANQGEVTQAQIRLSASTLNMKVGDQTQIKASVSPKTLMNSEATWLSTNEDVAIVKSGYVFAVGEGDCKVHVFIGSAHAVCDVHVIDEGGGDVVSQPSLRLSASSQTISLNGSFKLTYYAYPTDTTVMWESGDSNIATVNDGLVEGRSVGSTTIVARGSNGLSASCIVTVTDQVDINDDPVDTEDLGYTGTIIVGAPLTQFDWVTNLLNNPTYGFNATTNSSVNFKVVVWEEDKAADQMANPADGPDVYPYASDQTLRLYARKALAVLPKANSKWIKEAMGQTAYEYATLKGVGQVVGYPFASDNGYVMFYDKSLVSNPSEINTVDKLFQKAVDNDCEVNFDLTNGFYAAGTLMTYAGGESLYTLTAGDGGTYTSTSNFSGDEGIKAAKLMNKIFHKDGYMGASGAPGKDLGVLATITDTSKVAAFKKALGSNYAAAPLPYVSDEDHTRLGVYLGYKFYGVNPSKGGGASHLEVSNAVAKFLVSKTAQTKRYEEFYTKPTLTELETLGAAEAHIAALNEQIADNGTIKLTAVDVALWSQCMDAAKSIQKLPETATDADYKKILNGVDNKLTV